MKKFRILFLLALALLLSKSAFALQCKDGVYAGSDECWTDVKVGISETVPVIPGVVLKYDINSGDAETAAYIVRVSSASADYGRVAGVAQSRIATGDYGRILVRGHGKIRKANGVTLVSGDYLYPTGAATASGDTGLVAATGANPTAFSLQTSAATSGATVDAFIALV